MIVPQGTLSFFCVISLTISRKCFQTFGRVARISKISRISRIVIIIIISTPSDNLLGESMTKHKPYIVIEIYSTQGSLDSR